jgi:hypothetical protein
MKYAPKHGIHVSGIYSFMFDLLPSGLYRRHRNFTDSIRLLAESRALTAGQEFSLNGESPCPEDQLQFIVVFKYCQL